MKFQRTLFPALLIFVSSCQTTDIDSEFDRRINYAAYHSFSVCLDDFQIDAKNHPEYNSEKMKTQIKDAIESEMKNYYSVNDMIPELRVGVKISIEDKKFTYRSCDRQEDYHLWPECRLKTFEYSEGTLLIYVADVAKNQIIWNASIAGMTREDLIGNKKLIDNLVKSLFEKYPLVNKSEAQL
jgi:hypothetical protein